MGFLFLIVGGLLAMIGVARLAAKTTGRKDKAGADPEDRAHHEPYGNSKSQQMDGVVQKGLITLLLKKKIIEEEELLEEINRMKNRSEK